MPHAGPGGNDTRWPGGRRASLARRRDGDRVIGGAPDEIGALELADDDGALELADDDGAVELRVDRLGPGPTVVAVIGELDLAGVPTVRTQVRELLSRSEPVVLDLSATTFLDVSGVRLLVALSGEAAAAGAWCGVLPDLPPAVDCVLELTGLRALVGFTGPQGRPPAADRPEHRSRP